jgi:hypothetical protein
LRTASSATTSQPQPKALAQPAEHLNIADYPVNELLQMLAALLQKIVEANDLLHDGTHPADAAAVAAAASGNGNGGNHSNNSSQANDGGLFNNKYSANVLAFHGRNIPAISLYAYLTRILKYCPVTNDVFLSLLVYFDRIAKRANNTERTNEDAIMGDTDAEAEAETNNNAEDDNGNGKPTPQIFVMDSYNIHRLIISGITVASKFFSDVFYKNSRYAKVGGLPLEELNHLELQFLLLLDFQLMIQVEELERYGDLLLRFWNREHKPAQGQGQEQGGQEQGQDPHGE